MYKLVILIETPPDSHAFDEGWPQFLHWAEQMPGLQRETTSPVSHVIFGKTSYLKMHELFFDNQEAALQAMSSPAGQSAGRVLQSITHGRMTLLLADHLEDTIENIQNSWGKQGG